MDLFGENTDVIRTLGFYQPFGSLMLHGKIETRKVAEGRKPPFPKGKYLFYTTKSVLPIDRLYGWCGDIVDSIEKTLKHEVTAPLNGYAIAIATLTRLYKMRNEDEEKCFVQNYTVNGKTNWCLEFEDVQRIVPFAFNFGKQGIGFLPKSEYSKIILADKG